MSIAIIGAGASGLFCAAFMKGELKVDLYEKNEVLGKKLRITGNGRCNITNIADKDEFFKNIIRNKKFMFSSFNQYDNFSLIKFLEEERIPIVFENGKVFPRSGKSEDIVNLLIRKLKENKINVRSNCEVKEIIKKQSYYIVKTNKGQTKYEKVIVATGAKSYPTTGSDGFGYQIASKFNHTIIELKPALAPILIKEHLPFKALNLRGVEIKTNLNNKLISQSGDILLYSNVITGPAALKLSSLINRIQIKYIYIDLFPKYTIEEVKEKLIKIKNNNTKKAVQYSLKKLLNKNLAEYILKRLDINEQMKLSEISNKTFLDLARFMKNIEFTFEKIKELKFATVTSGGVDTKQINPRTMESKINKNLFFIGEVLDVDALSGGFNLQIACSTAYSCAKFIGGINENNTYSS